LLGIIFDLRCSCPEAVVTVKAQHSQDKFGDQWIWIFDFLWLFAVKISLKNKIYGLWSQIFVDEFVIYGQHIRARLKRLMAAASCEC